jgi:hypothetical protein
MKGIDVDAELKQARSLIKNFFDDDYEDTYLDYCVAIDSLKKMTTIIEQIKNILSTEQKTEN